MKPEDLSPTQVLQVVALGFIFLSLLVASFASWGFLIYRMSKGLRFQSAQKPTASIGFIDCLIGFLAVVMCFSMAIATWRIFGLPNVNAGNVVASDSQQTQSEIDSIEESPSPEATKSEETALATENSTANPTSPAKTQNTGEVPAENTDRKSSKSVRVISKEEVLGSGWLSAFQLVAAFTTMLIVAHRIHWDWRGLGLPGTGVLRDIGMGAWVLFLMLPPIVMINVATGLLSGIEYNHPIIDAIKNYPWLVGIIAFQAVIVAPITEEFLFRGLLIGWFESAHFGRTANAVLFGWKPNSHPNESTALNPPFEERSLINRSPYDSSSLTSSYELSSATESTSPGSYVAPWWPAIVSGILFGLAHFSYGVSWVPLIVFGIILGRVYQLRQSLIMCITVHMIFNGINILNLWLSLGLPTNK